MTYEFECSECGWKDTRYHNLRRCPKCGNQVQICMVAQDNHNENPQDGKDALITRLRSEVKLLSTALAKTSPWEQNEMNSPYSHCLHCGVEYNRWNLEKNTPENHEEGCAWARAKTVVEMMELREGQEKAEPQP